MKKLLILQLLILSLLLACTNKEEEQETIKEINIDVQYDGDKIVLKQDQFYKVRLLLFIMQIDEHTSLIPLEGDLLNLDIYKDKPLTILLNSNFQFKDESVIPNKWITYHYPVHNISKISYLSYEIYKNNYKKIDDMYDYEIIMEEELKITKEIK